MFVAHSTMTMCTIPIHIYPARTVPADHPAQQRAWTKVSPKLLDGPSRFAGYRGGISGAALDAYNSSDLGSVVWPQYPILYSIDATIDEIVKRP